MGDESKLAQSFERIRALVRKKRQEQQQNENNSRLEAIVREVMQRHAEEQAFNAGELQNVKVNWIIQKLCTYLFPACPLALQKPTSLVISYYRPHNKSFKTPDSNRFPQRQNLQ